MDGMKWFFHNDVEGTHLLFESFLLDGGWKLVGAYIFVAAICWTERGVTYYLDQLESKNIAARWRQVTLRTSLYGIVTVLRLWYMLITMYFNIGLFIVVVVALSSGQLVTEVLKSSRRTKYSHYTHPQYDDNNKGINSFEEEGADNVLVDQQLHHPATQSAQLGATTSSK